MRHFQYLVPLLTLSLLFGCALEEGEPRFDDLEPDLDQPSLDDPIDASQRSYGVNDDGDQPPQPLGLDEPTGEIHVAEVELVVTVGDEIQFDFYADVYDVDPDDTYITVSGAPAEALVDVELGTFTWIPNPHDVGVHKLGIDLWFDQGDEGQRILDARSILIEVVPRESLIEVGI